MADNLFSNWNFGNKSVTPEMMQGKYINARSTLIAAGPPQYSQISGSNSNTAQDMVYPIGFVENFGITQQRNLQRMFEIGSNRSFFIPGRTMSSANFGRVLFHGPSLLRVLYAYYPKEKIAVVGGTGGVASDNVSAAFAQGPFTGPKCVPMIDDAPGTQAKIGDCAPAEQAPAFYMNLASTLFDHALGILIYMKDIRNEYYSAFYLEFCHVTAHSMNINATSTVIAEGVGLQFDEIKPVDLS